MSSRSEFVKFLEHQVIIYRGILEDMFGPYDSRFNFGSIRRSTDPMDVPHTNFPNGFYLSGGCVVDIHISSEPLAEELEDQAVWQVAHECVHLIDPGPKGTANYLEEGLATWFQDEIEYHINEVQNYIRQGKATHNPQYTKAKEPSEYFRATATDYSGEGDSVLWSGNSRYFSFYACSLCAKRRQGSHQGSLR